MAVLPLAMLFAVPERAFSLGYPIHPANYDSSYAANKRTVTRGSDAKLHVIYIRSPDGAGMTTPWNVFYAFSTDNGQSWTEEQVAPNAASFQLYPSITIDSNNVIHVVWYQELYGGTPQGIFYTNRTVSGWQTPVNVTATPKCYPAIAVDSANNLHLVWDPGGINYKFRTSAGAWQGTETITATGNQHYPAIGIDTADNVHVAWEGTGWGINTTFFNIEYCKRTAGLSGTWQTQEPISDINQHQFNSSLAVDSTNNVHVAWWGPGWGPNPSAGNINYRLRSASANTWQPVEVPGTISSNSQRYPSIALDAADNVHVVWNGYGWGANTFFANTQYRMRAPGISGTWQTQVPLTDVADDQLYPNLLWAPNPTVSGLKTSRPKTGYAYVWYDSNSGVRYFPSSNLSWDTSGGGGTPVITSLATATGQVGLAFSYQITATNSPTSFNATGLPAGLSVNTGTGQISGTPTTAGTSNITLTATNASGPGTATLTLTIYSACDVNKDNATNVLDVQLEVNQALGVTPCTADINKDSLCNIIDVQRVTNAALGGQCVSP